MEAGSRSRSLQERIAVAGGRAEGDRERCRMMAWSPAPRRRSVYIYSPLVPSSLSPRRAAGLFFFFPPFLIFERRKFFSRFLSLLPPSLPRVPRLLPDSRASVGLARWPGGWWWWWRRWTGGGGSRSRRPPPPRSYRLLRLRLRARAGVPGGGENLGVELGLRRRRYLVVARHAARTGFSRGQRRRSRSDPAFFFFTLHRIITTHHVFL
jgi:hypothetical protein